MNYPTWLPYPRCFGRSALTLLGLTLSIAIMVLLFMLGWQSWEIVPNLLDPANMTQYQFNRAVERMIEFSAVLGIFGFVIFPIIMMIWIRKIVDTIGLAIKKQPVQWKIRPALTFQGFGDFIICYFSVLVAFIFSITIIDLTEGTEIVDDLFIGTIFITQSYCYYARNLMHEGRAADKERQQQKRQTADQWREYKRQGREKRKSVDPIEAELNQLKREEEQNRLREEQQLRRQQQEEKRRQKAKPPRQKQTSTQNRRTGRKPAPIQKRPPKKKPTPLLDFPEEFLETETIDPLEAELDKMRRENRNKNNE
ncbi:hypothetical protein [Roseofilum sp. Belize Diploria]|uniref:hypothetical protein n=1 Tax=Roseofilum sp. Belize Diploria TaxID=2821501 RepID=UPI001B1D4673|nr:hypothetical protein [Roseofilum sp. Belize Diploria]MBP0008077.1 hypothetical protein [Roseofilum sp. Belize Diploria]